MKVLISGATGFLGSHLAELLVREGHQVRALVRRTSKTDLLQQLGVELQMASLEGGEGLDEAVEDVDAVVHGAGLVKARSLDEFTRVNAGGTKNLLEAVERKRPNVRRFVYVSSLAAHGFSDNGHPRAEHEEARPVTNYGRSKLEGERAVVAAADDLPVSVVRPPAIYGPRDGEIFAFFQMISRRVKVFIGSRHAKLSLVYAPDCARAIRDMLVKDHPSGRVYFVDDGHEYTMDECFAAIEDALGVRALPLTVPVGVVSAAAVGSELYGRIANRAVMLTRDKLNELKQPYLVCRGERIRSELGWLPEVDLYEGARRTAQWYREQGWL